MLGDQNLHYLIALTQSYGHSYVFSPCITHLPILIWNIQMYKILVTLTDRNVNYRGDESVNDYHGLTLIEGEFFPLKMIVLNRSLFASLSLLSFFSLNLLRDVLPVLISLSCYASKYKCWCQSRQLMDGNGQSANVMFSEW